MNIIQTNLDITLLNNISEDVTKHIFDIVFANEDIKYSSKSMWYFTCANLRKHLKNPDIIYYDGKTRFPYINKHTGFTNVYCIPDLIKLSIDDQIISPFKQLYNTDENIVYNQGPCYPIIKPYMSEMSPGICYLFDPYKTTYTGYLDMTHNISEKDNGELEYLSNFSQYYELLNKYYYFNHYTKGGDLLFLESWFNLFTANDIIKYITFLHNSSIDEINEVIDNIPQDILDLYEKFENDGSDEIFDMLDNLPIIPVKMEWLNVKSTIGNLVIFDNKTPIRTIANKKHTTHMYMSVHLVPQSYMTDNQYKDNYQYYKTGKIGNWIKPGLRYYTRSNMGEYNYLKKNNKLINILDQINNQSKNNLLILGCIDYKPVTEKITKNKKQLKKIKHNYNNTLFLKTINS